MSNPPRAWFCRAWLVLFVALAACASSGGDAPGSAGAGAGAPPNSAGTAGAFVSAGAAGANAGQPGVSGAGGASSAGAGGLSAGGTSSAGAGGSSGSAGAPAKTLAYFDFSAGDKRGYSADGDFSPGHWKGECAAGQAMTGLSAEASCPSPRVLQCEPGRVWTAPTATVSPNCGDARRDSSTGDWDNGYRKGECGANEAVVGVARDSAGAVYDLVCADASLGAASTGAGACTVRNVNAGDNRGRTTTGDWDAARWKSECADGEYVKGISLDSKSRHPHALLCCAGNGAAKVTPALKPEPAGADTACVRRGADSNVTAFDKAHLTGGSRNIYQTSTFPEQGSYERITMTLTLACPAGGCDPWDRWGNIGIVLKKNASDPGGDQILELGRFVTPYGVGGTFKYDVTDLRPALSGKQELRIFTDTWVDGWLATVKFEMKGGVPAKEPSFVMPLWTALHVGVGVPSKPISNSVPTRQVTVDQASCGLAVRAIITGHGQGNRDNCAEFCAKTHYYKVGTASHGKSVWRDDCASTAVQNQNGTWQYPRAGWCPGADVRAFSVDVGADVNAEAKAGKKAFPVAYDVEGYDNTCRPDNCSASSCVFGTGCAYDNGAHTEPYYAMTAVLIGYK